MSNNKQSVAANFFWKFAERVGAQVVTLVVSIVLARILLPEHYGTISIILIFISSSLPLKGRPQPITILKVAISSQIRMRRNGIVLFTRVRTIGRWRLCSH